MYITSVNTIYTITFPRYVGNFFSVKKVTLLSEDLRSSLKSRQDKIELKIKLRQISKLGSNLDFKKSSQRANQLGLGGTKNQRDFSIRSLPLHSVIFAGPHGFTHCRLLLSTLQKPPEILQIH